MFNWFRKKTVNKSEPQPPKSSREELIEQAQQNARAAREALGPENLARLAELIHKKQAEQDVSPAAQARKIIARMDTDKISEHLRYLRNEPPTKH